MTEDLFVCDVDYDVMACMVQDYWREEDRILKELISILSKTYEHGIASGEAHDNIGILKDEIKIIYEHTKGQGEIVYNTVLEFLQRIDEIDLKLYGDV